MKRIDSLCSVFMEGRPAATKALPESRWNLIEMAGGREGKEPFPLQGSSISVFVGTYFYRFFQVRLWDANLDIWTQVYPGMLRHVGCFPFLQGGTPFFNSTRAHETSLGLGLPCRDPARKEKVGCVQVVGWILVSLLGWVTLQFP